MGCSIRSSAMPADVGIVTGLDFEDGFFNDSHHDVDEEEEEEDENSVQFLGPEAESGKMW